MFVSLVLRVHRHRRVPQKGLGPRGGHHHLARAVGEGVADVPELAVPVLVLHLDVGEGRVAPAAPVDEALAAVDESSLIELDEGGGHGLGAGLVHGEAGPPPVQGAAELAHLHEDRVAGFLPPRPHPRQEVLPPQVVAGLAFFLQELLDDVLGGDAAVVGPRQPKGVVARHAAPADQHVLEGVVQGVAHVEGARHVGRRQDDGVGAALGVRRGLEEPGLLPAVVEVRFRGLGIVKGGQFGHGRRLCYHIVFGRRGGEMVRGPARRSRKPVDFAIP